MDLNSLVGKVFDERYLVLAVAGSGGMGTVFKARQLGLERLVALKILSPDMLVDDDSSKRFEREARSISILKHDNIAEFYSFGCSNGIPPYIVMEFLEGESLRALLNREEKISWQRALHIAKQVCKAMAEAHSCGMVHRDLKPNNIMLLASPENDFVKIVDFGLAKFTRTEESGSQKLTQTGALVGTVQYLSPEQCLGLPVDGRADIYSLGCVLYEMLVGEAPFSADNPIGLIHKHIHEEPRLASQGLAKSWPVGLNQIIFRAMCKDKANRYQSMEDFEADMCLIEQGQGAKIGKNVATLSVKQRSLVSVMSVVWLLISLSVFLLLYSCFSSESFSILWAQKILAAKPDRKTILYWFNVYDKWDSAGRSSSADQLLQSLKQALRESAGNITIEEMYLNLARESQTQKNKQATGRWARRAFGELVQTLGSREMQNQEKQKERDKRLLDASQLMLDNDEILSKSLFTQTHLYIAKAPAVLKLNLLQLEYNAMHAYQVSPTDNLVNDLLDLDVRLGENGQTAKMESIFPVVIAAAKKQFGSRSEAVGLAYNVAAREFARTGEFRKAADYLKIGLDILESRPDDYNIVKFRGLMVASTTYRYLGQVERALQYSREAQSIACLTNSNCLECAIACMNYAELELLCKHCDKAYELARQSLALSREQEKEDPQSTIDCMRTCISALLTMGKRELAIAEMEQFIIHFEKKGGLAAAELPEALVSLADKFLEHHDFASASKYYKRALQVAGKNCLKPATKQMCLMNLLRIELQERRIASSFALLLELRQIPASVVLETQRAQLISCLQGICGSLRQIGKGKIYEKTVEWIMQLLRGDSNSIERWQLNGFICGTLFELGESKSLVPVVTELASKCSPQSNAYISAMAVLAAVLSQASELELAEKLVGPLVCEPELRKRELTSEYLDIVCNYAAMLSNVKRYHEAESILFTVEARLDSQKDQRTHIRTYLGEILYLEGKFPEAEALARSEIALQSSSENTMTFRGLLLKCFAAQRQTKELGEQALLVADWVLKNDGPVAEKQEEILEAIVAKEFTRFDLAIAKTLRRSIINYRDKHGRTKMTN